MNPLADRALAWIIAKHCSCHHSDWIGIEINFWLFCDAFRSYILQKSGCSSFSLYVYLSAPSWDFFVCSMLRRIETALGNIKEGLVVDLHILMNFSVLSRSALLNFLDLPDTKQTREKVLYLVHFAKTLQGHLVKNNSHPFRAEDFGLWNSLSGWRALWVPRTEQLFSEWICLLSLRFSTFLLHFKGWWKCFSSFACAQKATDTASKNTVTLTYPLILSGSFSKGLCNVEWPRKQVDKSTVWLLLM